MPRPLPRSTSLTASVVIPTYHRPVELAACIRSIVRQTLRPRQIVVVDDGALDPPPGRAACAAAGIDYRYERKTVPGLTESRNRGVALSRGQVVFFLDDDVDLFPDYIERIMAVFAADRTGRIGGVGGLIHNTPAWHAGQYLRYLLNLAFLNTGLREGRVLPSGFCTNFGATPFGVDRERRVDFLSGGVCAYRREVFRDLAFTDGYRDLGMGEDKDFACRVSRRYILRVVPTARLNHYEAPRMRPAPREHARKFVIGRHLFFRRFVRQDALHRACFVYAVAGYGLIRLGKALISRRGGDLEWVAGVLDAVRAIRRGHIHLFDPAVSGSGR